MNAVGFFAVGALICSVLIASCASITGLDALMVGCVDGCDAADSAVDRDARFDGSGPPDGRSDASATPPGIRCGSTTCAAGGTCCFRTGGGPASSCATGNCNNPAKDIEVTCDTPDDCPGALCCATTDSTGTVKKVQCSTTCAPGVVLCDQAAENRCPAAAPTCVMSARLAGYFECAP